MQARDLVMMRPWPEECRAVELQQGHNSVLVQQLHQGLMTKSSTCRALHTHKASIQGTVRSDIQQSQGWQHEQRRTSTSAEAGIIAVS